MWVIAVSLFALMSWLPVVLSSWPKFQALDQELLIPQLKLLFYLSPPFAEKWPGPLGDSVTQAHRLLLSLVHGGVGWVVGGLLFRVYVGWAERLTWLAAVLFVWFGFLYGFARLLSLI